VRCAWKKCREVIGMLTRKDRLMSAKLKGKVYATCVSMKQTIECIALYILQWWFLHSVDDRKYMTLHSTMMITLYSLNDRKYDSTLYNGDSSSWMRLVVCIPLHWCPPLFSHSCVTSFLTTWPIHLNNTIMFITSNTSCMPSMATTYARFSQR